MKVCLRRRGSKWLNTVKSVVPARAWGCPAGVGGRNIPAVVRGAVPEGVAAAAGAEVEVENEASQFSQDNLYQFVSKDNAFSQTMDEAGRCDKTQWYEVRMRGPMEQIG